MSVHADNSWVARTPDKLRRSGYAPAANAGVGRRGLHTRDRILGCAAEAFLANGFHATSLDAIAKAAGASRPTVYQYFAGKEETGMQPALHCSEVKFTQVHAAAGHKFVLVQRFSPDAELTSLQLVS